MAKKKAPPRNFGARMQGIRNLRRAEAMNLGEDTEGWSQEGLAYKIRELKRAAGKKGPSLGSVRNWETGGSVPRVDDGYYVAKALGVSLLYLLGETDDPGEECPAGPRKAAEAGDELLSDVRGAAPGGPQRGRAAERHTGSRRSSKRRA